MDLYIHHHYQLWHILTSFLFYLSTLAWKCLKTLSTWSLDFKIKTHTFLELSSIEVTKYDAPPKDLPSFMQTLVWTKSIIFDLLWGPLILKETMCFLLEKQWMHVFREVHFTWRKFFFARILTFITQGTKTCMPLIIRYVFNRIHFLLA